jgi:hypothetical protein
MKDSTDAIELSVLQSLQARSPRLVHVSDPERQEALISLDRKGLAMAYTDAAYSLGAMWGRPTDAGRAALTGKE